MLKNEITKKEIKKIFGNRENKVKYLNRYFSKIKNDTPIKRNKIDSQIIESWDYDISKSIIRKMFTDTYKYAYLSGCREKIDMAINEWYHKNLGKFEWPFSAMNFDSNVHLLNRNIELSEDEKDETIARKAVVFRRIKHINALRNDYIEYLIFQNDCVIPTFGNNKGVDFYIDGKPYDQKVAKSVGKAFIKQYGDDYRNIAIENPNLVAVSMYENQDEERFGDEPRLLIVYLDPDVNSTQIENQLKNIDFNTPMQIDFRYKHSKNHVTKHHTECFIILLHH